MTRAELESTAMRSDLERYRLADVTTRPRERFYRCDFFLLAKIGLKYVVNRIPEIVYIQKNHETINCGRTSRLAAASYSSNARWNRTSI